jgi:hypothetical protein
MSADGDATLEMLGSAASGRETPSSSPPQRLARAAASRGRRLRLKRRNYECSG